jgi:hypothetical protein
MYKRFSIKITVKEWEEMTRIAKLLGITKLMLVRYALHRVITDYDQTLKDIQALGYYVDKLKDTLESS